MCGICGIASEKSRDAVELRANLACMVESLAHRGPDAVGVWVSEPSKYCVGLGHTRLAIRDLSPTGAQPMMSRNGRWVIAYNGEVYSHNEIASDLRARGMQMRGTSDTEVIVEAVSEFGVMWTVERLIGMFAIALFDKASGDLHLVRDRLGIKPLYWTTSGEYFAFASELKALRAIPNFNPTLDRHSIASYMRHNYIPSPGSIYENVWKLEPGTWLRRTASGQVTKTRFWDARQVAEAGLEEPLTGSNASVMAEVETLLRDSVKRRLIADVPIGSLLSGGIDSSLVTALMAQESAQQIKTFSVGFHQAEFNEAPFASQVARHLGTDHTELYVEPNQVMDLLDSVPYTYDEPFADSSQLPTMLVCALTRDHVKVVLTGDGGDELFAGYGRYFQDFPYASPPRRNGLKYIDRQFLKFDQRKLDAAFKFSPLSNYRRNMGHRLHQRALRSVESSHLDRYRRGLSHWQDPGQVVIGGYERRGLLWDKQLLKDFSSPLSMMQYIDLVTYLPDDILVKVDRASMRVGLEARVPLLDHRLVALAWRVPERLRHRGTEGKWLLKQIAYQWIPRELLDRPKQGFGVPIDTWLRGPLNEWANDLLSPNLLRQQGLLDESVVTETWSRHQAGQDLGYPLWDVLMLQQWLSRWH